MRWINVTTPSPRRRGSRVRSHKNNYRTSLRQVFTRALLVVLSALLLGCPSTKEVKKEEAPPPPVKKAIVPDIIIRVGTLDLAKLKKKIERADIERLAGILRTEKIDIFALQGIVRYPELKNRIDPLKELAGQTGMRQVFGENLTVSGRQTGNAILSNYPIQSNTNTPFDGIQSTNFESALQAMVDCGIGSLVVVSTHLPDNASADDQKACVGLLRSFSTLYSDHPIIIAGNLPTSEDLKTTLPYDETGDNKSSSVFWFSKNGSLKLSEVKTENTPLGRTTFAEFGIFRKPQP